MSALPQRTRTYQNHHLNSTKWDRFVPRNDDIVIATPYKAGTTWTQAIVANLLFPDQAFPAPVWEMSPWLDFRPRPLDEVLARLEAQRHRRMIKTHLALDGLRFFPQVKYIFVSRDGRDVFMSMWNHYTHYTEAAFEAFNSGTDRVGAAFPQPPPDLHALWADWCTRGWFNWEHDGWPFWSHLHLTQTWWDYRHCDNILVLHYADMKRDIAKAVAAISDFLDTGAAPDRIAEVAQAVSLERMREMGEIYVPRGGENWKGGARTFLHKGSNGRWRDVLSAGELALYDAACDRTLSDDCRAWLEHGGDVS